MKRLKKIRTPIPKINISLTAQLAQSEISLGAGGAAGASGAF